MNKHRSLSFSEFVNERYTINGTSLTDAQFALIYLLFKSKTGALQQPYRSMEPKELRIQGGLSDQTVRHRIREMQILSGQEDVAQKGDEYYETILSRMTDRENLNAEELRKTARLFYQFQELPVEDVAAIAMEAFTEENQETGQHYYDKNIERQNKYAQDKKTNISKEKSAIQQLVSDYSKALGKGDLAGGRAMAIKHAAKKFNKTEAEIAKLLA